MSMNHTGLATVRSTLAQETVKRYSLEQLCAWRLLARLYSLSSPFLRQGQFAAAPVWPKFPLSNMASKVLVTPSLFRSPTVLAVPNTLLSTMKSILFTKLSWVLFTSPALCTPISTWLVPCDRSAVPPVAKYLGPLALQL